MCRLQTTKGSYTLKINIANGELNNYLNLNAIQELDLVKSNDAEEIVAPFIFNSIPPNQVLQALSMLRDRLKYDGKLILGGYDVVEFAKLVLLYQIDVEKRQEIIFNCHNFFSLEEVTELVKKVGFKILSRKLDGMYFLIEGKKL